MAQKLLQGSRGGDVPRANLVIYQEDLTRINACLNGLQDNAQSQAILLIENSGQLITTAGKTQGLDSTSLAALAAGHIASAGGLAQLIGEKEFSIVVHQGVQRHLYIALIGRVILLVIFDYHTPPAKVRLRVKKFTGEIEQIFDEISRRPDGFQGKGRPLPESIIGEVTDAEVEGLFGKG